MGSVINARTLSRSIGNGASGWCGSGACLRTSTVNPRYLVGADGKAVLLAGSHSWNSLQDTDKGAVPAAVDFNAYVSFLIAHGHNCTILWKKDLPTYFNWGAGGTWQMAPHPWPRTGPSNASDGLLKFDLSQFDQTYFDRLRARVAQLNANNIYAIVELFDGLGLFANRGAGDGYPFSSGNNINSIADDGAMSSMTMTSANAITAIQDTYVKKVIDTVNDFPNVIIEISEEAPSGSDTWWAGHMIDLVHSYEASKPMQHPVLYPTLQPLSGDAALKNTNADVIAMAAEFPGTGTNCGSGTPTCKPNINDSDHTYFGMWNDSKQTNRQYVWKNVCNGHSVLFMDPYLISWSARNTPGSVTNGVGLTPDTSWDTVRDNLGRAAHYSQVMNLMAMTPQTALSSTTYALARAGFEYLVYAPTGGTFTVDLSAGSGVTFAVEWYDCAANAAQAASNQSGGSASQSFVTPGGFTADAVLYLKAL